jgi:hypothetical protein
MGLSRMKTTLHLGRNERRILIGALIAAAFFLVEAGIIEIVLGLDQECREAAARIRLAPDPFSVCLPEWQWLFLHSASRGFLWLFNQATPALLAGLTMAVLYSIIGAISVSIFRGHGVIAFLAIHIMIVASVAGLSYLSQYIA